MSRKNKKSGCCYQLFNFNTSNETGALDVIIVQDEKNRLRVSPFNLIIGKFSVLYPKNKKIKLLINDEETNMNMWLSKDGIAYFEY